MMIGKTRNGTQWVAGKELDSLENAVVRKNEFKDCTEFLYDKFEKDLIKSDESNLKLANLIKKLARGYIDNSFTYNINNIKKIDTLNSVLEDLQELHLKSQELSIQK